MKSPGRLPALRAGATLFAMLLLCGVVWAWLHSRESEAPISAPTAAILLAPGIHFSSAQSATGTEFSLATLRGTPVLVHFWATWCGPCVRELPELARELPALKRLGLAAVVISEDTDWNTVKRFLARNPELAAIEHESLLFLDPAHRAAEEFASTQYPETFLLDRGLGMAHKFTGAQAWSHPEMRAYLTESISAK